MDRLQLRFRGSSKARILAAHTPAQAASAKQLPLT